MCIYVYMNKTKIGRNDICNCGSNLKYKKCCLNKSVIDQINTYVTYDENFLTFDHFADHIQNDYFNAEQSDYKTNLKKYINENKSFIGPIIFLKTHKNKYYFKFCPLKQMESMVLPDDLKKAIEYYKENVTIKNLHLFIIQGSPGSSHELSFGFRENFID